jgi:hypothetical protein
MASSWPADSPPIGIGKLSLEYAGLDASVQPENQFVPNPLRAIFKWQPVDVLGYQADFSLAPR